MPTLIVKKVVLVVGLNPLSPAYVSADVGGDVCPNDGYTFLHLINGSGGELDVQIDSQVKCDQGVIDHNLSGKIAITTGQMMIGPFDKGRFNNSSGQIEISYPSGITSLTIAAISVKP